MKRWSTSAWILLSIAHTSKSEPAELYQIIACADFLNHALPTHKELQRSFGRLLNEELITISDKKYSLTIKGQNMIKSCTKKNSSPHKILAAITDKIPGIAQSKIDDSLSEEDVQDGYAEYLKIIHPSKN